MFLVDESERNLEKEKSSKKGTYPATEQTGLLLR